MKIPRDPIDADEHLDALRDEIAEDDEADVTDAEVWDFTDDGE